MSSMFWECASCGQKNPAIVQNCSCAKQKAKWQQRLGGSVGDVRAFLAVIGVCVICSVCAYKAGQHSVAAEIRQRMFLSGAECRCVEVFEQCEACRSVAK